MITTIQMKTPSVNVHNSTQDAREIHESEEKRRNHAQNPKEIAIRDHAHHAKRLSQHGKQIPTHTPPKHIARRSSKPIINWFQRKLAGTVKTTRRFSDAGTHGRHDADVVRRHGASSGVRSTTRVVSSPLPQSPAYRKSPSTGRYKPAAAWKEFSPSRDEDAEGLAPRIYDEDDMDRATFESSLARESMWSPASMQEADEDASVRPIAPSAPPSPSPSRSSSSYLSDPRTFRSMAASTKPTTLLSIDLAPAGMAHIAQVPATPVSASRVPAHVRTPSTGTNGLLSSAASITFSALPPSPQSSRPSSPPLPSSVRSISYGVQYGPPSPGPHMSSVQAPQHTAHHPRNNPRPSSPPLDNASVLTLASSAFAIPGQRMVIGSVGWSGSTTTSTAGGGDSMSHFGGGSISGIGEGEMEGLSQYAAVDDEPLEEEERDASLRALRPRSSRRGSWGSEVSRWSARVTGSGPGREKSLLTVNSAKADDPGDTDDTEVEPSQTASLEGTENHQSDTSEPLISVTPDTDVDSQLPHGSTPLQSSVCDKGAPPSLSVEESYPAVDCGSRNAPLPEDSDAIASCDQSPISHMENNLTVEVQSLALTDSQTETVTFHSASSTPVSF